MPRRLHTPQVTTDGHIMDLDTIQYTPEWGKPYRAAEVVFLLRTDMEKALVRELISSGEIKKAVLGRSGHSRIGLHPQLEDISSIKLEANRLTVQMRVYSLRDAQRDNLLSVLGQVVEKMGPGKMEIGRMFLSKPEMSLSREEIQKAQKDHQIQLPETANISEEGIIELSLEDMHYFISERTFNAENMEKVLVYGKHELEGIQGDKIGFPSDEQLTSNHFFLGGIRIAIGPFIAIIEEETSQKEVSHLAARMLDGVRTTGLILPEHARQVELFKNSDDLLDKNLKIRLRLYPANGKLAKISERIINERTLHQGVTFRDITEMKSEDSTFMKLVDSVSETQSEKKPWGLLLTRGKAGKIDWDESAPIQRALALIRTQEILSGSDEKFLTGDQIPDDARELTELLGFVGGTQTHGKILITSGFPSKRQREELFTKGIGIFVAKHLQQDPRVFDENLTESPYSNNDEYFSAERYADFREAEKAGVQFYGIFEETIVNEIKTPRQVRAFHKGFWVLPEACEKMDQVDTIIAMYGSHKDDMIPHLREQIEEFMSRMKKKLGNKLGITHGNGPGVMWAADQAAANHDIFRLGVSIGVEKLNQKENPTPPARVGFLDEDRLARQNLLDNISNFTLFNIGGAGTMEEIAITICSQKLRKNIITPIIFVDPFGLGENKDHIWKKLKEQIAILSEKKSIDATDTAKGIENLQLLQDYAPRFCHFVKSYDQAAEILETFLDDPIQYYKTQQIPAEDCLLAYEQSQDIFKRTGFSSPHWINEEKMKAYHQE